MAPLELPKLSTLVGGDVDAFIKARWGQRFSLKRGAASVLLTGLPTRGAIDEIVFGFDQPRTRLGIVRGYAAPVAGAHLRKSGRVALDEIYSSVESGTTLLLSQMHHSHLGIALLCRSVERDLDAAGISLRTPVGANLFLTPGGSQGFDVHFDGHDVFVVQLEGTKTWKLFEPVAVKSDGPDGSRVPPDSLGHPTGVARLQPGDVLYIPRGTPHCARATKAGSLHLTLSVVPNTWRALLSASSLSRSAKQAVRRRIVSSGRTTRDRLGPSAGVVAVEQQLQGTLRSLREKWIQQLSVLPRRHGFGRAAAARSASSVQIAPEMIAQVSEGVRPGFVELQVPGLRWSLPSITEAALHEILEGNIIKVSEFRLELPPASKRDFASKLISQGVLVILDGR